jgi:hypothetical protein
MDADTTEAVRHVENLQNIVNQHRILLERQPNNEDGKENFLKLIF